jgi:hypothetical protein
LLIDGREVEFSAIWIHAQDDPYPGGHRYCLRLPAALANDWMEEVGLEPKRRYTGMEHLSRDGLFWLASKLSAWRMERNDQGTGPLQFVINTISEIEPEVEGIEVRGICSPFVHAQQRK